MSYDKLAAVPPKLICIKGLDFIILLIRHKRRINSLLLKKGMDEIDCVGNMAPMSCKLLIHLPR